MNASFGLTTFTRFLLTILLLGAGAAILQVAGNPIMRDVSDAGRFARNLTLGQFVKAIGSLSGAVIPVVAARAFGASWASSSRSTPSPSRSPSSPWRRSR